MLKTLYGGLPQYTAHKELLNLIYLRNSANCHKGREIDHRELSVPLKSQVYFGKKTNSIKGVKSF